MLSDKGKWWTIGCSLVVIKSSFKDDVSTALKDSNVLLQSKWVYRVNQLLDGLSFYYLELVVRHGILQKS